MKQQCAVSGVEFEISDWEMTLREKASPKFDGRSCPIPPPTLAPAARLQKKLAYFNQIHLYPNVSKLSKKPIVSLYPKSMPFPVLDNEEWWGDSWDALKFGRDIDFSKLFFPQFEELRNAVPHIARFLFNMEDCHYCNNASNNKTCYMIFNTSHAEDCMYGENVWSSKDCIDCSHTKESELCYDCLMCLRCYRVQSSEYCENCHDSYFLLNCRSCKDCFGCVNLRQKRYCVYNEQLTKENYEQFLSSLNLSNYVERADIQAKVRKFWGQHPRPHMQGSHLEDVSGNHIVECKNVFDSFLMRGVESARYCYNIDEDCKNCLDYCAFGRNAEMIIESIRCGSNIFNLCFCYYCFEGCSNLFYCAQCVGSQDCFGCVGLKKKQYCIFNKQYSEDEYNTLVPQVIRWMEETGEWGEFFPMHMSHVPYNHTVAQRYFPLTEKEAKRQKLVWHNKPPIEAEHVLLSSELPEGLPEGDKPIVVSSKLSQQPFRITAQEIKRYRSLGTPLPRLTYDERMEDRIARLGGLELYQRVCPRSGETFLTNISPESSLEVWSKKAYDAFFC